LGTWQKHVGTSGEESLPAPITQKNKIGSAWVHAKPFHHLFEIFISKIVHHHFLLGLILVHKTVGTNVGWLWTCRMVGYAWSHIRKLFGFWYLCL
jgi:hypothetical protein